MGIELSIIAGLCYASSSVNATGADHHPVTEAETELFGLSGEALAEAVAACLGEPPDLAQLDGFLHRSHDWCPVTTTLVVQSASVTGVGSMPVSLPLTEDGARLMCTATHVWSPADGVSPTAPVRYSIAFPAGGGAMEYGHAWGTATIESASVDLPPGRPGDEVVALGMNLGVRIVYDAYLSGEVAVHYRDGHQGHRYWALDIGTVMAAGGLLNGRHFAENLSIRYHASTRVVHADADGNLSTLAGPGIRTGADLALAGS
ncbi:hypothetical protein Daura_46375 [Dactylosporangium aurantiacum]|uniref:Uncharacterized protein n=1 Tax=Dactylosporangium aurantiacum TaxID=35754 RepID=A0A9Q9IIQ5_9ACTN|nr:hypothetical protein [Dactylosporangium aurantiacum]MDG6108157.1 hypothetical protein [Dactylosporangium aurantiacum]UWZ53848.1 hypothetical protein Daura_46375 [Dactylosporangium aurantiacum]